jgi:hypothetical protein
LQNVDERVTPLTLDGTSASQIQKAADEGDTLDVLINNAGVAKYDDLSNHDVIEQHFAVNLFGIFKVTRAFLPLLKAAKGAIVNNLSLAARPLAGHSCLLDFDGGRVQHDAVAAGALGRPRCDGPCRLPSLGPIDTDMTRGFEIPKASPESAALGIFNGLEKGEEDIFPDPASLSIAEGWRTETGVHHGDSGQELDASKYFSTAPGNASLRRYDGCICWCGASVVMSMKRSEKIVRR